MATFYIIHSNAIDRFYIGSCALFDVRLSEHNNGKYDRAFTKRANDWTLFYKLDNLNPSLARLIERHVKKMKSRKFIHDLKKYPELAERIIDKYSTGILPKK